VRQVEYVLGTRVLTNSTGTDPVLTRGAEGKINEVIAAYLLQNTLVDTPHDRLHSQVFDRVTFSALESRNLFERVSESDGIAGFFHLSFFAATIPYIQGMLLYFLSMTFPFFALLLLIPSRASGALHWLGLWVWVKSWDVGFALVGVVREILWQHLGRGVAVSQSDIQWNDPSTVFAIMNRKDILASFGTFYSVSELLTISIPFITAHICLGADSFYSIFRGSIDKTGAMMRGRFNAGTRRADATSIDKKMAQDINNKSLAAIKEHAQRGWGTTSNGVLRILAGDGTLSRYIEGVAADAAFKAKFEQADYRVISGQNTTRTMTYGGGFHVLPLAARINLFQEPMTTRYFYQAPNLPIAGYPVSTNPGDGSTNLPRKNRSLIPGDSVDGW
jgi:hypothetical protein